MKEKIAEILYLFKTQIELGIEVNHVDFADKILSLLKEEGWKPPEGIKIERCWCGLVHPEGEHPYLIGDEKKEEK